MGAPPLFYVFWRKGLVPRLGTIKKEQKGNCIGENPKPVGIHSVFQVKFKKV